MYDAAVVKIGRWQRMTSNFSAETYFATQPAPANLEELLHGVRKFIDQHSQDGKRLVLVTV